MNIGMSYPNGKGGFYNSKNPMPKEMIENIKKNNPRLAKILFQDENNNIPPASSKA